MKMLLLIIIKILILCSLLNILLANKIQNYSMVLIGGGLNENNTEIWDTIITLAGGKNKAKFGVIAAAGEDPCCDVQSSYVYYEALLKKYGASEVYYIPVTEDTPEYNTDPKVIKLITNLTGFFFGGGDQLRVIRAFYNGDAFEENSPVLNAIKESAYNNNAVIVGTSAGTDCLTNNIMITGGTSYTSLLYGTKMSYLPYPNKISDELGGYTHGIGLFNFGLLDTHFENRGRHGRFIRLLADTYSFPTGNTIGFGIDENTALVITNNNNNKIAKVIGQRGVIYINMNNAIISEINNYWSISNLLISHLTSGDNIYLSNYTIIPAIYKTSLKNREKLEHAIISDNIFASESSSTAIPFQFNEVATSLFNSKDNYNLGYTIENKPKYVVNMTKLENSLGVDGIDPETNLYWISYYNMDVSIYAMKK